MKALVTGSTGFVGTHLVAALRQDGWIVDRFRGDIRTPASARKFRGDAVFHLAAQPNPGLSLERPVETLEVNALGTLRLLEALRGFKGRIVLVSTGELYRPGTRPHQESDPLQPQNPYAVSKLLGEETARAHDRLDIVIARPFNHTGPGQAECYVCPSLARQVLRSATVRVGQLESRRDFTDVRDVVRAYSLLFARGKRGETYNVCSGRGRRIREILETLIRLTGRRVKVVVDPDRVRPPDTMIGNPSKLKRDTGWHPAIPLERTLRDLLDSIKPGGGRGTS